MTVENPPIGDRWYRLDTARHAEWAPFSETQTGIVVSVRVRRPRVVKVTPAGVWLAEDDGCAPPKKFVLKNARKRWAYPTLELALESFLIRKERQIEILRRNLEVTELALQLAKSNQLQVEERIALGRHGDHEIMTS